MKEGEWIICPDCGLKGMYPFPHKCEEGYKVIGPDKFEIQNPSYQCPWCGKYVVESIHFCMSCSV